MSDYDNGFIEPDDDEFEEFLDEDEEIIWSERLEGLVSVSEDMVNVDLPELPIICLKLEDLRKLVANDDIIDKYTEDNKSANFYKELLPQVLGIAEEKIKLYQNLGFTKW